MAAKFKRGQAPQMFMGAPAAQQATQPAGMFSAPLRQREKQPFDWASLLQGVGAGLLTGRNIGEGLGQGLVYARQFGDQRADNERLQRRDDREEERYQYGLNKDQQATTQAAAEKAARDAAIDQLPIDPAIKAVLKAGDAAPSYGDLVPKAAGPQSGLAKLKADLNAGLIDQPTYDAAVRKENYIAPSAGSSPTERERNALSAGLQRGTPEWNQYMLGRDDTAPGPFQGTGLDAQSYNMVLTGDPTKPEYAAAYAQLAMPKVTFDPVTQKMVMVAPDMTWARPPGGQQAAGGAAPLPAGQPGMTTQNVPGATITSDPGSPIYNEGQGKAAGFADRIAAVNPILDETSEAGTSQMQTRLGQIPLAGNYMISGDRQRFEQAERDFINAILRRESGAVISDEEFANARQQYIPQPGDKPENLAQKKAARERALNSMQREGGPFYKPTGGGKKTVIDGIEIEELP